MTKLQTLQNELSRLNNEILTDTGYTLRQKTKRIVVITDTIARELLRNPGVAVIAGSSISAGVGLPLNIIGKDSDLYINVSNGDLLRKEDGVW